MKLPKFLTGTFLNANIMFNRGILPAIPYGLCFEERGWRYTEKAQSTPSYLGDGAVGWRWNFSSFRKKEASCK